MSYKHSFESGEDLAYALHYDRQRDYEKSTNAIMGFSFFGGVAVVVAILFFYGSDVASLCAIAGMAWYILGYHYCLLLWNKEKDAAEFRKAVEEYEKTHPSENT